MRHSAIGIRHARRSVLGLTRERLLQASTLRARRRASPRASNRGDANADANADDGASSSSSSEKKTHAITAILEDGLGEAKMRGIVFVTDDDALPIHLAEDATLKSAPSGVGNDSVDRSDGDIGFSHQR